MHDLLKDWVRTSNAEAFTANRLSLSCSYGYRMKQKRGTRYVAHLESRVEELETEARGSMCKQTVEDEVAATSNKMNAMHSPGLITTPSDLATLAASPNTGLTEFSGHHRTGIGGNLVLETINCAPALVSSDGNAYTLYRGKSTGIDIFRHLLCLGESFLDPTINRERLAAMLVNALDRSFSLQPLLLSSMTNDLC